MGKVELIKDRCIGCGACMSIAPENFTFGDDGRAEMINSELTNEAIEASEMCPVSAIAIENSSCKNDCSCEHNNCSCGDDCNCTEENNCGCLSDCNCEHENCSCGDNCNCTEDNNCGCK